VSNPREGDSNGLSLLAAVSWSGGVYEIPNSKHQISGFQVSGVREENKKTET
jgi:hypothetical protein